ncbi:hypothetical protein A2454_01080 [Candidatus Peribacteria bacterium RIFOXYC2_FULL_55_14]|nr:MAG: hypothetical protein A2198_00085 [Candidatus Peribacteria bacterium RIFOXYA1_FULL_56_14]OGJ73323.1 MAG: hypothetical protein A2217_01270 [Candidatus Peribacteria bacterium RIFOXYA2_FULL_55_28]OGJ74505.1 MAG: hypothetical protein A2384_02560 [Candidatus Peribacteria bacterium RIFOXYB1_FULL_54_35]OGJ77551.1 MAG: hypothetical protein A2327_04910 [Candidatus Peribacteria bacterium RIFOXYB2_FULL_54_17]OGJ78667.1 MAG: hypothetical protein A2424_00050 [Candidatus Peribacteria bacterium RIFOXYC
MQTVPPLFRSLPAFLRLHTDPQECYNDKISLRETNSKKLTHKLMSIDACIAHAIHNDLDILEALPEIHDLPVEEMETYIEKYVCDVHQKMRQVIVEYGDGFVRSKDAAGLCATCLQQGIPLPAHILLKMCQTIVQMSEIDARFILDTEDGKSLYYMKMQLV